MRRSDWRNRKSSKRKRRDTRIFRKTQSATTAWTIPPLHTTPRGDTRLDIVRGGWLAACLRLAQKLRTTFSHTPPRTFADVVALDVNCAEPEIRRVDTIVEHSLRLAMMS